MSSFLSATSHMVSSLSQYAMSFTSANSEAKAQAQGEGEGDAQVATELNKEKESAKAHDAEEYKISSLTKTQRKNRNRKARRAEIATKYEGDAILSLQRATSYINQYPSIQRIKCLGLECDTKHQQAILPCKNCGCIVYCSSSCQRSSTHPSLYDDEFSCSHMITSSMKCWKYVGDELATSIYHGPGNEHTVIDSSTIVHARDEMIQHVIFLSLQYLQNDHVKWLMRDNADPTQLFTMMMNGRHLGTEYWREFIDVTTIIDDIKINAAPCTLILYHNDPHDYNNNYDNILGIVAPLVLCSQCKLKKPLITCPQCSIADQCADCSHSIMDCMMYKDRFARMRPRLAYLQRDIRIVREAMRFHNTISELISRYNSHDRNNINERLQIYKDIQTMMSHGEHTTFDWFQHIKTHFKDYLESMKEMNQHIKQFQLQDQKQPGSGEEQDEKQPGEQIEGQ